MHESSYTKMKMFVDKYLDVDKKLNILDLGSYDVNGSYKPLFNSSNWKYEGCDISAGPNVDIIMSDLYTIPKENDCYDVIISGQALEHMEFFWKMMEEVARIVKPNGLICIIAPGSGKIHRYPIDCWRFHPDGMDVIIKWINFIKLETYIDEKSDWWDCVLIAKKKE